MTTHLKFDVGPVSDVIVAMPTQRPARFASGSSGGAASIFVAEKTRKYSDGHVRGGAIRMTHGCFTPSQAGGPPAHPERLPAAPGLHKHPLDARDALHRPFTTTSDGAKCAEIETVCGPQSGNSRASARGVSCIGRRAAACADGDDSVFNLLARRHDCRRPATLSPDRAHFAHMARKLAAIRQ